METNLMADRFGAQAFQKDDYLLVRIEKKEKAAQTVQWTVWAVAVKRRRIPVFFTFTFRKRRRF